MIDTGHNKSGVVFWSAVVATLALAYLLSFGPVCWITSRANRGVEHLPLVYRPILSCWETSPILVQKAIRFYALVGSPTGWEWERINGTQWRWLKYRLSDAERMDWTARKRKEDYERFLKAAETEEALALGPTHLIPNHALREELD